jgi:2-polyprenyl-3-methyl-5-hydroxy-6-metoxy-1,4-benzoquinol methylase
MPLDIPTTDDRLVWDVWLSMWWLPSVTVADELEIFDHLAERPATPGELSGRLGLDHRGVDILLPLLASLGFLVLHEGRYRIGDTSRNFLLRRSPFYWGGVFLRQRETNPLHATIRDAVTGKAPHPVGQSSESPPVEAWESGRLDLEQARNIARFMHSHSLPAATGVALHGDFHGVTRLLDVGGGSGCFAIALAQRHAGLRCTVLDLPAMCQVADEHIAAGNVAARVDTTGADMLRDAWPAGYDAVFLSNILHDWSLDVCAQLARSAHAALPAGGRVYVHEMLLDDSGAGPRTAAAFSMLMLVATRGRQFTYQQLKSLLQDAGFGEVDVSATYGYYSLIRARKT